MPTPFERLMPTVNAGVDSYLGDSLIYETAPGVMLRGPGDTDPTGFVRNHSDDAGPDVSPVRSRWTLKISMSLLPGGPVRAHRLTCDRLQGEIYQPSSGTITQDGRYWYCDLQKAPANG